MFQCEETELKKQRNKYIVHNSSGGDKLKKNKADEGNRKKRVGDTLLNKIVREAFIYAEFLDET